MPLTSRISDYDSRWPAMYEVEKVRLETVFASGSADFHHVGSTAVPGLAAKPEIDVLVIVGTEPGGTIEQKMSTLGYVRGKDLSYGHQFYRRDVDGVRTHKVHVCVGQHPQIQRMIRFRDLLRQDSALRRHYQELKLRLEAGGSDIKEYLAGKAPFIDGVMRGDRPDD